jgi:hypothetical protein
VFPDLVAFCVRGDTLPVVGIALPLAVLTNHRRRRHAMRVPATRSIAPLVLAACMGFTPIHADEPPKDGPPKPAELKELDRLVGSWDTHVTFKPSVWQPEGRRVKGSVTSQWTLGGWFVREGGHSIAEDVEHTFVATYDAKTMAYRAWYFDSMGASNE